jgi:hypothetical protein
VTELLKKCHWLGRLLGRLDDGDLSHRGPVHGPVVLGQARRKIIRN